MSRTTVITMIFILLALFGGANFLVWYQYQQAQQQLSQKQQTLQLLQRQTPIWIKAQGHLYTQRSSRASLEDIAYWLDLWLRQHPGTTGETYALADQSVQLQLQLNNMQELLALGTDLHYQLPLHLTRLQIEPESEVLLVNLEYERHVY